MVSKKLLLSLLLMVFVFCVKAQFRLPQIDVEAKGAFSLWDNPGNYVGPPQFISWQGGAHIQVNQRIAIGGFYSRSLSGTVKNNDGTQNSAQFLMRGIDLRLSAGRSAKLRPYLSLNYSSVEFVEPLGGLNLADKTTATGATLGLMRKLGNNLYWNIVEVNYKKISHAIYWLQSDFTLEAKTGFTYNIRIKSK